MISHRRWRALLVPVILGSAVAVGTASVQISHAETDNFSYNGNCNNWVPHGWSTYSWSGAVASTHAFTATGLYEWSTTYNSYVYEYGVQSSTVYGTSGTVTADAYWPYGSEYGTKWQVQSAYNENGSYSPTGTTNIWCGGGL